MTNSTLVLTAFKSILDKKPHMLNMKLENFYNNIIASPLEIKEKADRKKLFSLTQYKENTTRGNEGIEIVTGLVLDFDNKSKRKDHIASTLVHFKDYCHLWYTTFSHQENIPRWRLILPFQEGIAADLLEGRFLQVEALLQDSALDPVGKKPAQIYYVPYKSKEGHYQYGASLEGDYFPFHDKKIAPPEAAAPSTPSGMKATPICNSEEEQNILDALSSLDPDMDYQDWIDVGMALNDHFGEQGLLHWRDWSNRGAKFKGEQDIASHWKSFHGGKGKTIASLFSLAKASGYQQGSHKRPTVTVVTKKIAKKTIAESTPAEDASTATPLEATDRLTSSFPALEKEEDYYKNWGIFGERDIFDVRAFPLLFPFFRNFQVNMLRFRPELALSGAITSAGFLAHHYFNINEDTNFFALSIGSPGMGKNSIIQIVKANIHNSIYASSNLGQYFVDNIGTAPALIDFLHKNDGICFAIIDEIAGVFKSIKSHNASTYKMDLQVEFKKLFSRSSSSTPLLKTEGSQPSHIEETFFTLHGLGTELLFDIFTVSDLSDGLLSRFLVFWEKKRGRYLTFQECRRRELLAEENALEEVEDIPLDIITPDFKPFLKPTKVRYTQEAMDFYNDFGTKIDEKSDKIVIHPEKKDIYIRLGEHAMRLSFLTCNQEGIVNLDGMKWAISVVVRSFESMMVLLNKHFYTTASIKNVERVERLLKKFAPKYDEQKIKKRVLLQHANISNQLLDTVLKELEARELVKVQAARNENGTLSQWVQYFGKQQKGGNNV